MRRIKLYTKKSQRGTRSLFPACLLLLVVVVDVGVGLGGAMAAAAAASVFFPHIKSSVTFHTCARAQNKNGLDKPDPSKPSPELRQSKIRR